MQTVIFPPRASLAAIGILSACLLLAGCGWNKTMVFPSPSGKRSIEVWQTGFDNSRRTRIDLVTSTGRRVVFENHREALVYFVHVYWTPDESTAGVFLTGPTIWKIAFGVPGGKEEPFLRLQEAVGRSIKGTYDVPPGEDPFAWATTSDGYEAFFKLHPEIRLTYR